MSNDLYDGVLKVVEKTVKDPLTTGVITSVGTDEIGVRLKGAKSSTTVARPMSFAGQRGDSCTLARNPRTTRWEIVEVSSSNSPGGGTAASKVSGLLYWAGDISLPSVNGYRILPLNGLEGGESDITLSSSTFTLSPGAWRFTDYGGFSVRSTHTSIMYPCGIRLWNVTTGIQVWRWYHQLPALGVTTLHLPPLPFVSAGETFRLDYGGTSSYLYLYTTGTDWSYWARLEKDTAV